MKINLFTIIFLVLPFNLFSLDPNVKVSQYQKVKYDLNSGLPQNSVWSVMETKDRYIWLATQEGVVKFDGKNMKIYDRNFFKKIKNLIILTIVQGNDPNWIWIATQGGGLIHFNYITENYKIYTKKDGLLENYIYSLYLDSEKRLWVFQRNGKISLFKNGKFKTITTPIKKFKILSVVEYDKKIYFSIDKNFLLYFDKDKIYKTSSFDIKISLLKKLKFDKKYIFIGDNDLYHFDFKNRTYKKILKGVKGWKVRDIMEDSDQNIWILTGNKGVYRYRKGSGKIDKNIDHLKTGFPVSIIEDRERNIWISDYFNGAILLKESKMINYTKKDNLPDTPVYSLYFTPEGEFYVGTLGDGIFKYDGVKFNQVFPELKNEKILSIDQDKDKRLWGVTYSRRIFRVENNQLNFLKNIDPYSKIENPFMVFVDSKNRVWIGTADKGVYVYKDDKYLFNISIPVFINSIKESDDGRFWLGTYGKGIYVIKDGKVEKIYSDSCGKSIFSIFIENRDSIWAATTEGICFYNGKKFYKFGKKDNLPVYITADILVDDYGSVWGTSSKGVIYFKKKGVLDFIKGDEKGIEFKLFGKKEGMINPECNGGSQYNMVKYRGKIYIPTMGGIVIVDPKKIDNHGFKPAVYIEKIKYDDKIINRDIDKKLIIPAGSKKFEFNYTAPSFKYPKYVKFRYKLDGYDKKWIDAKDRRTAYYTNLPPGEYNFKVIASNGDNIWNMEGDHLKITILPLFTQTIWFTLLQIMGGIILVVLIFSFKLWQSKKARIKLQKLVDEQTKELREAALKLKEASLKDPLTGLKNRRFLTEVILPELKAFVDIKTFSLNNQNKREVDKDREIYSLYLCDIDHFKRVNDNYGHEAGDRVLKQFSDILKSCIRDNDFVIRWGGEEFLVILKNSDSAKMDIFINRFRKKMDSYQFIINDDGDTIKKSCSVGYLKYPPIDKLPNFYTFDQAVMIADLGLYYSKKNGRNMGVKIKVLKTPNSEIKNKTLEDLDFGIEKGIYKITTIKG